MDIQEALKRVCMRVEMCIKFARDFLNLLGNADNRENLKSPSLLTPRLRGFFVL